MSNEIEKEFDYDELQQRGEVAAEFIKELLDKLDLLISIKQDDNGKRIIIFSDRDEYVKNNKKRAVSLEVKNLNTSMVYNSIEDVPEHLKDKVEVLK